MSTAFAGLAGRLDVPSGGSAQLKSAFIFLATGVGVGELAVGAVPDPFGCAHPRLAGDAWATFEKLHGPGAFLEAGGEVAGGGRGGGTSC